ncbi:hypothetical protein [Microbacterium aurantiacum]|uniref:Uncharacterized protein n=1 Tax=Microbacterium aurantiacum TaxID=162393 RepID=A0ABT8FSP7_9MICO|nr:hypothetical protein [Microbacterium aurantiacum]MDN4463927.1 hypothetical protein [Microbacterium aurantiacum]
MIRAILTALVVVIAVLVAPHALDDPAINSADLILVAAPIVVLWLGIRRRRPRDLRQPWIQDIPEDHPDALGSLDLLERQHQPWRHQPPN